jgi:hypothetical protein
MDKVQIHIPEDAPDFTPGYPSKGAQIGPAWQLAWDHLRRQHGKYVSGKTVADHVMAEMEVKNETVRNLLHAAARAGYLDKGEALIKSRRHTTYKIRRERWR